MSAGRRDAVPNAAGMMELNWGHIQTSGQLLDVKSSCFFSFFFFLIGWNRRRMYFHHLLSPRETEKKTKSVTCVTLASSSGFFWFFLTTVTFICISIFPFPSPHSSQFFPPLLFIVDCNYSDNHDGRGATLLLLSSWFTLWLPPTSWRFLRRDTVGALNSLPESQPVPFLSRKPL